MKNVNEPGLFDVEGKMLSLSGQRDPLVGLRRMIDWEQFRPILEKALRKEPKGKGGRPPFDCVMMFRILILQRCYNLSDDQTEYQITDRLSFMRFLGLRHSDKVPDAKTIWHFREQLTRKGVIGELFGQFLGSLGGAGLIMREGSIVDASFVEVPVQRNTKAEKDEIREGRTPSGWEGKVNKLRQKDTDARWTKKNGQNVFGLKVHVKADQGSKLIMRQEVTAANVHDSQMLEPLLDETDAGQPVWADRAYIGKEEAVMARGAEPRINERARRNHPLTDEQKEANRLKSKVRARVEHIFGFVENSMGGSFIRSIGMARAKANIALLSLTYNMRRALQLMSIQGITAPV
jgi:transposase, IS5 family